ncbi:MAG TPA: hydrogenase nickel incorporation protein HypB [Phycisphaerae bacterium]|nr:hydrogenase nickel incorporation protein HypB [Phycisphaerae bacterium]HRY69334.1 hydrogenase nickel incorporation protein HypB [Phycisphaerae bacterium]HSA26652.1 hydrogenase nickel incorporation protein HypB [Phycisphaerae bacterium]
MMKVQVVQNVLKANDAVAAANRRILGEAKLLALNLMSSPGSGKTTLLEKTIPMLGSACPSAVLVGDLQTTRDAERLSSIATDVVQINTGTGCHLSATQVAEALTGLDLGRLGFLFIENVGNMVCPADFDLGEHRKVVLLSVPEGDDKVAKYYTLFQRADIILLTKVELLSVLDFRIDRVQDDLAKLNTRAPFIQLSAKTGQGMDQWITWLHQQRAAVR